MVRISPEKIKEIQESKNWEDPDEYLNALLDAQSHATEQFILSQQVTEEGMVWEILKPENLYAYFPKYHSIENYSLKWSQLSEAGKKDYIFASKELISKLSPYLLSNQQAAEKERKEIGNWLDNQQRTGAWVYLPLPKIMELIDGKSPQQALSK